jgi:signal transduction histidine kinase
MAWNLPVYSFPIYFVTCVAALLAAVAWRHRTDPVALPFAVLMVALAQWSLADAVGLGVGTAQGQLFWERVGFLGAVVVPAAWLALALRYTGRGEWLTRRNVALLAIEPLATLALVWTNEGHGLVWRGVTLSEGAVVPFIEQEFGPWYLFNQGYSYVLVLLGVGLLVRFYYGPNRLHRKQVSVLIVGAIVPLGANVLFALGRSPLEPLDPTPFSFVVTGIVFSFGLFEFDLLDLPPVARETLFERLSDGIVVLDAAGEPIDANPAAQRILKTRTTDGRPVSEVLADASDELDELELWTNEEGRRRTYVVRTTPVADRYGRLAGQILVLNDVTPLVEREQRIGVLNRVLRHNIRNDMAVVLGYAEQLDGQLDAERRALTEPIRVHAERALALSEKARELEALIRSRPASEDALDVSAAVERVVDRYRESHPTVAIEFRGGPARAFGVDERSLEAAVSNLVENAIVHNDAVEPSVEVSVAATDSDAIVAVADNGPGIPEAERAVLEMDAETSLEHGSGLGLWLVQWCAAAAGGELEFAENDSRGSVVRVSFPRGTEGTDEAARAEPHQPAAAADSPTAG